MSTKVFYHGTVLTLSVLPVMALAACGEGYVAQPYHGVPYTYERTAGTGVEWVRASMAKPKEMKTETIMQKEAPAAAPVSAPPPPMSKGDKVFNTKQAK